MLSAPIATNETERLGALRALKILDTPSEDRFDRIVQLAAHFFTVPIAYVALVDKNRQWFKSRVGLEACETQRDISFCAHTILLREPLVIPDAAKDPRFADNPLVTGEPHIRFYAGVPLAGPEGHNVGTFCIASPEPREFGAADIRMLERFAEMAGRELKLAGEFAEAAGYVQSFLPARLTEGPVRAEWSYIPSSELGGDAFGYRWLDENRFAVHLLDVAGHGLGAAMLSMGVMNWLHHAADEKDLGCPAKLLGRLNDAYPMERHGGRFFTIWYGVYDRVSRQLIYSNGGHPAALLVGAQGNLTRLSDGGPAIGIIENASYERGSVNVSPGDRFYLFSDGLYEVSKDDGNMWTYDDFSSFIARASTQLNFSPEKVIETIRALKGHKLFSDDVSLIQLCFE